MTVSKIIEHLKSEYKQDDEIIIAWWDKNMAPCPLRQVSWEEQVSIVEGKMDWSSVYEKFRDMIYWDVTAEIRAMFYKDKGE
jgi:hypothetical protein